MMIFYVAWQIFFLTYQFKKCIPKFYLYVIPAPFFGLLSLELPFVLQFFAYLYLLFVFSFASMF